ncbi:MAG: S-layer homology domain-containing protein [Candidatus Peribacteraceae bacterium]|nr:S-layer homology domain-containing protein [Candidatus Peribacteraceae bacterium]
MATAAFFGVIAGDTDHEGRDMNTFRPDAQINRAEVAKIIAILRDIIHAS